MPFLELSLTARLEQQPRVEEALQDLGALSITLRDADAETPDEQAIFEPGVGELPLWPTITLNALFDAGADRRGLTEALGELLPWLEPDQLTFRDIADYDPDVFVTLDIVHANPKVHDPRDERTRRSHLAKIVTRKVNKLICIPVLKDHGSGGVTLALKNMSHGFENNVCRSHGTHDTNTCNLFIPAIVSHPLIRQKACNRSRPDRLLICKFVRHTRFGLLVRQRLQRLEAVRRSRRLDAQAIQHFNVRADNVLLVQVLGAC